ncbi:MAG: YtxH domain-containing protein [Actinomycetota bacterium]|nr:YtxH domain-containing protein [Actinomycetota bacterium]
MKNCSVFRSTLLVFALGVFAGLLIAPRKGEETRKILRERMEEYCIRTCGFISEKTAEVKKQAGKYAEKLKKDMEES